MDSIRDAVFTVSPNKQYLGILSPTTPAAHGPTKIFIVSLKLRHNVDVNFLEKGNILKPKHFVLYEHLLVCKKHITAFFKINYTH